MRKAVNYESIHACQREMYYDRHREKPFIALGLTHMSNGQAAFALMKGSHDSERDASKKLTRNEREVEWIIHYAVISMGCLCKCGV